MGSRERGPLKKLIEAARYWVGLGNKHPSRRAAQVDNNVLAGLRAFGVREECISEQLTADAATTEEVQDFEVYADCWESVQFFLQVRRLWVCMPHMVPLGMGVGFVQEPHHLDMCAVEAVMNMQGVARKARAALLADLQVMEGAALAAMQAQRAAA